MSLQERTESMSQGRGEPETTSTDGKYTVVTVSRKLPFYRSWIMWGSNHDLYSQKKYIYVAIAIANFTGESFRS